MKNKSKNVRLATSGVLIGLATILSIIKVFSWPFGGSVTLFSMVPLIVLSYMYGVNWGMLCGAVYGVLQMILGATMSSAFAGLNWWSVILMALLDYIVAYVVIGLSGMFKNTIKKPVLSIALGSVVAILIRLACHFLSGWIFYGSYAEWFFGEAFVNSFGTFVMENFSGQALAALYSLVYNSLYMIPELVISVVGVVALMAVKPIRQRLVSLNNTEI